MPFAIRVIRILFCHSEVLDIIDLQSPPGISNRSNTVLELQLTRFCSCIEYAGAPPPTRLLIWAESLCFIASGSLVSTPPTR